MKSLGIRRRILLAAFAPAALVALLVSGMLVSRQVDQTRLDQHRRLYAVARQLASGAEFSIFSGNTDGLQKLLESALTEPDVVAAAFLDPDGKILASTLPIQELPPPEEVCSFAPHSAPSISSTGVSPSSDRYGDRSIFGPTKLAPHCWNGAHQDFHDVARGEIHNYTLHAAAISTYPALMCCWP
jgi:hypothetical protein